MNVAENRKRNKKVLKLSRLGSSLTYTFSVGDDYRMVNSVKPKYKYARIHFKGAANDYLTVFNFTWCAY